MSDDSETPRDEVDPGTPVDVLAGFEYAPSPTFLGRIRRSIYRRTAVSQVASFSWNAPMLIFREFWLFLAEHFFPKSTGKDHQQ
jgi:hypothetical protein